jgi:hypothetical protein
MAEHCWMSYVSPWGLLARGQSLCGRRAFANAATQGRWRGVNRIDAARDPELELDPEPIAKFMVGGEMNGLVALTGRAGT